MLAVRVACVVAVQIAHVVVVQAAWVLPAKIACASTLLWLCEWPVWRAGKAVQIACVMAMVVGVSKCGREVGWVDVQVSM